MAQACFGRRCRVGQASRCFSHLSCSSLLALEAVTWLPLVGRGMGLFVYSLSLLRRLRIRVFGDTPFAAATFLLPSKGDG